MPEDTRLLTLGPSRDQDSGVVADEMLTVAEVATWLKVSRSWIYERTRTRGPDRLPHIKLGKYLRFDPRRIREYVSRHAVKRDSVRDERPGRRLWYYADTRRPGEPLPERRSAWLVNDFNQDGCTSAANAAKCGSVGGGKT
jgi:predicted DNA-binding transcriptional regulator AlpA